MEKKDIPLKILIIDPDKQSSKVLYDTLNELKIVISVEPEYRLDNALGKIENNDYNAIYIDPLLLDITETSDFILKVREIKPEIVYVFYLSFLELKKIDQYFKFGGYSFHLYFKLDKNTPTNQFKNKVIRTIESCQSDLSYNLTQEKINKLKEELKSLEKNAKEEIVQVPKNILNEIKEQLNNLNKEYKDKHRNKYISADFLGSIADVINYNQCFIVMPYTKEWSKSVEEIIKSTCEEVSIKFTIAKSMEGRFIPNDIWQGISGSGIIIADLTGANPNVAYEIGLADALGRDVILVSQSDTVPFDFLGQRLIIYENTISGALKLKDSLKKRLNNLIEKYKNTINTNNI